MSSKHLKIKLGISIGDYNGIGPEIILKFLKDKNIADFFTPVVFGSGKLLSYQKNIFKIQTSFHVIDNASQAVAGKFNLVNVTNENLNVDFGQPHQEAENLALQALEVASQALSKKEIDVLISAPINKIKINEIDFTDQKAYFDQKFNTESLPILVKQNLKIAFVDDREMTQDFIKLKINSLNKTLIEDFCIERPKIAVLGFGSDHKKNELISSAIDDLFKKGNLVFGTYPIEDFFASNHHLNFDATLVMDYKNQENTIQEVVSDNGILYFSGLPFVVASPNQDVSYEIAGKDLADFQALSDSVFMMIRLFRNRAEYHQLMKNRLQPKGNNITNGADEDISQENE